MSKTPWNIVYYDLLIYWFDSAKKFQIWFEINVSTTFYDYLSKNILDDKQQHIFSSTVGTLWRDKYVSQYTLTHMLTIWYVKVVQWNEYTTWPILNLP